MPRTSDRRRCRLDLAPAPPGGQQAILFGVLARLPSHVEDREASQVWVVTAKSAEMLRGRQREPGPSGPGSATRSRVGAGLSGARALSQVAKIEGVGLVVPHVGRWMPQSLGQGPQQEEVGRPVHVEHILEDAGALRVAGPVRREAPRRARIQIEFVHPGQRQRRDAVVHGILGGAGVHDPEVLEFEIPQHRVHGLGHAGRLARLELEAPVPSVPPQKQVQLRAPLGGIVVGLAVAVGQEHLLECESLPACAVPGVTGQVAHALQAEQVVEHPAVPQVDLGRFNDALRDVLGPRGQQPNHERADQQIPVAVRRGRPDVERARDFRGVPPLPVEMGHHPPATADGLGRYARRDPRDVALNEGLRERVHPIQPVGRRVRQERTRKPASQP